jgi:hypothetical protein
MSFFTCCKCNKNNWPLYLNPHEENEYWCVPCLEKEKETMEKQTELKELSLMEAVKVFYQNWRPLTVINNNEALLYSPKNATKYWVEQDDKTVVEVTGCPSFICEYNSNMKFYKEDVRDLLKEQQEKAKEEEKFKGVDKIVDSYVSSLTDEGDIVKNKFLNLLKDLTREMIKIVEANK